MTSPALLAHLAGDILTTCTLVTLTRRDGQVFGFTDLDRDLSYGGITYRAGTFTPSAVAGAGDMSVANLDVQTLIDPSVITVADLVAGLWNYAQVRYEQVNYEDLTQGPRILLRGTTGEVKSGLAGFSTELRGLTQALQQNVGELSSVRCRADLGDARCGVNLTPLTVAGSVQIIDPDNRTITDTTRTEPGPASPITILSISTAQYAVAYAPAHGLVVGQVVMISGVAGMLATELINGQRITGTTSINGSFASVKTVTDADHLVLNLDTRTLSPYVAGGKLNLPGNVGTFDGGKLIFTSGANAGRAMEIKAYAPGLIVLSSAMPYPIQPGDTYTATPGCGKRVIEDCFIRYSNVVNFRGEPYRPGMDAVLKTGGT